MTDAAALVCRPTLLNYLPSPGVDYLERAFTPACPQILAQSIRSSTLSKHERGWFRILFVAIRRDVLSSKERVDANVGSGGRDLFIRDAESPDTMRLLVNVVDAHYIREQGQTSIGA